MLLQTLVLAAVLLESQNYEIPPVAKWEIQMNVRTGQVTARIGEEIRHPITTIQTGAFLNAPNTIKCLQLDSHISIIQLDAFRGLEELEGLTIMGNLHHLTSGVFKHLKCLVSLDLFANKIHSINNGAFDDLGNLERLNLGMNRLKYIESMAFTYLNNLKDLLLRLNELSTIHWKFEYLKCLISLDLKNNQIHNINIGAFDGLSQLTTLKLANNQLDFIKTKVFITLSKLNDLDLSYNRIKTLSDAAFAGLEHLEKLDISRNKLKVIKIASKNRNNSHGPFEGLANLRKLFLSNNVITYIDQKVFTPLHHLERLDLFQNKLTSVEYIFVNLFHLNKLDMSQNTFSEIPPSHQGATGFLQGLVNVEQLSINTNKVVNIPCFPLS